MKQGNDQADFEEDLVRKCITDVLQDKISSLIGSNYFGENLDVLSNSIINDIMKELIKSKKLFKYTITSFIQQKVGAAVNFGCSFYAEDNDGIVSVCVDDHPYIDVIISVGGVKITQK